MKHVNVCGQHVTQSSPRVNGLLVDPRYTGNCLSLNYAVLSMQ